MAAAGRAMIDRWSAARHAHESPLAVALLRATRLTWFLFIVVACLHLFFQYQLQQRLLADVLEIAMSASEARTNERTSAMRAELLTAITSLEARVAVLTTAFENDPQGAAALLPTSRAAKEEQRGGQ